MGEVGANHDGPAGTSRPNAPVGLVCVLDQLVHEHRSSLRLYYIATGEPHLQQQLQQGSTVTITPTTIYTITSTTATTTTTTQHNLHNNYNNHNTRTISTITYQSTPHRSTTNSNLVVARSALKYSIQGASTCVELLGSHMAVPTRLYNVAAFCH